MAQIQWPRFTKLLPDSAGKLPRPWQQFFTDLELLSSSAAEVSSFEGRTGDVVASAGDYAASEVTNDSGVAGTNVDDALDTLNSGKQPIDADLTALAALASTGHVVRTAANTYALRTITAPAAGFTISNGDGVAGNPTFSLANDLAAIEALGGTGIAVRTAADTWAQRTITAPAAGITVSNANGVSGNPTLALANDLAALEGLGSTGLAARTASDTWAQRTITGTANEITVTNGNGVSGNPTLSLPATINLGGKTSLEIPNGTGPTVDADGEIAVDTSVTDFSHGLIKYFGGEELGVVAMPIAQFTAPTDGYVVAYNAANDEFVLAAPGGGSSGAAAVTLASGVATSGTAVDIDGFFTSAYSYYELKFSQARPSGDAQLSLQVLVASVVDSGTNYRYSGNTATTSPSAAAFGVGGSSEGGVARIELCHSDTESSVAHGISGNICIYDPLNTTSHKDFTFAVQNRRNDGFRAADYGGGTYEGATSALSGIRLLWDGGESFQNIKWTLIGYPD